ncbi:MAG: xylulokinase [Acidimicrobiales bacterium]
MRVVAGVDSSTTATKVELRDAGTGALLAMARALHPPTSPPRSEQDPASWWEALREACHQALAGGACRPGDVDGLSVAAQQHGMVALDGAGEPVWPAKLWNDTQSAPDARVLIERLGGPASWAASCGTVPVAAFTVTKLAWLRRCHPGAFARLDRVLLPHDWLTWRLTGRSVTDRGDASGTGYWGPSEEGWRTDLLRLVDDQTAWEGALPEVLGPAEQAGELGPGAAADLGLAPDGVAVGPGTGDNMAAALGLGLAPGDVAISIGTSGTVYAVAEAPTADPTGAVAGFADATGRFLPLVCTLNATKVTDAWARILGVDRAELDSLALSAPPGAGGVVLVPYLDGERTPNRPLATGTLTGLRSDSSRAQVARAAVEGVVCGLLDGLDSLAGAGVAVDGQLTLTGGGARSEAYRRVLADLSGREVMVPEDQEMVARGACLQAAAVAGGVSVHDILGTWPRPRETGVEPSPGVDATGIRERYKEAADRSAG